MQNKKTFLFCIPKVQPHFSCAIQLFSERSEIDLQVGIYPVGRNFLTIRWVVGIEMMAFFPSVGHAVVVAVLRCTYTLELRFVAPDAVDHTRQVGVGLDAPIPVVGRHPLTTLHHIALDEPMSTITVGPGPSAMTASRKLPGPESSKVVTSYTLPPLPPTAYLPYPSAVGKARGRLRSLLSCACRQHATTDQTNQKKIAS